MKLVLFKCMWGVPAFMDKTQWGALVKRCKVRGRSGGGTDPGPDPPAVSSPSLRAQADGYGGVEAGLRALGDDASAFVK